MTLPPSLTASKEKENRIYTTYMPETAMIIKKECRHQENHFTIQQYRQ
jgi:hypothetical protein